MSKLQKPNYIIFIGASLYKDLVIRGHIERVYPYIKDAVHVDKYPTYNDKIIEETLNILKFRKYPTAMFVLAKYFDRVNELLQDAGFKEVDKDNSKIYTVNGTILVVKKIDIFSQLPKPSKINNKSIANFKAFGPEKCLETIEDKLQEHASIVKVLPTWYNIEIKDKEGEELLIKTVQELNVHLLPIRSLRASIIEYFSKKGKTISCAESCTGGLIASKLTAISGASEIIEGTMVTYSNRIKKEWLGVKEETLKKYGAVSEETVKEMLIGIKEASGCNVAIAVSGIAGPTGGTEKKPVGTVYIGIKNDDLIMTKKFNFKGDRSFIQEQSARAALEMLIYSEPEFFDFF